MTAEATVKFAAASLAIISPLWLPIVEGLSQGAALLLPILGCSWMVVQIIGYFVKKKP